MGSNGAQFSSPHESSVPEQSRSYPLQLCTGTSPVGSIFDDCFQFRETLLHPRAVREA